MAEFHFLRPWVLLALLPLAVLLWRLWRAPAGAGTWAGVVDAHLLQPLLAVPGRAARLPFVLAGAGWLLATLALAGPTWSQAPPLRFAPPLPPLVLVFDLSRSMDAEDVGGSRLALARARTAQLLDRLPPRRYALVVFAGSAHVAMPFTDDVRLLAALLPQLATDLPPVQGSAAGAGLERARLLLRADEAAQADVLLIADSADRAAAAVAGNLRGAGARVSVLAVGTPHGRIGGDIAVPLDEDGLRAAALAGGGAFVSAERDPAGLVEALSAGRGGPATEAADAQRAAWRDRGPLLLLALLPLAALAFRRDWLGAVLLAAWLAQPAPARAAAWQDLWQRPDQRAHALLQEGVALSGRGEHAAAAAAFARAEGVVAHYNRGTALARAGRLEEARDAFERALSLDAAHADARFNLALVEEALAARGPKREPAPHRDAPPPPPEQGGEAPPDGLEAPGRPDSTGQTKDMDAAGDGDGEAGTGEGADEPSGSADEGREASAQQDRPGAPRPADGAATTAEPAVAEATPGSGQAGDGDTGVAAPFPSEAEQRQALEQWLERVPDEPASLLKELFLRQHRRERLPAPEGPPW